MVSVVIPAYNEAEALPAHLARLLPVLEQVASGGWEVLVVDDGSTDRTAEVVEAPGRSPGVRLVRLGANRGKGAAVRAGVAATTGEMVLVCDADMATPPESLLAFVQALRRGADVVIGNRRGPGARIERPQPWLRRTLGWGFLKLCQGMTRLDLDDFNCGFKLFRGAVAREVLASTTTDGWAIDMECLGLAVRRGWRVVELPVVWRAGDGTAVRLRRDVSATFGEMLRIWWRLRRA